MNTINDQIWAQGRKAYSDNVPLEANPYSSDTTFRRIWREGWQEAQRERQNLDDERNDT